MIECKECRKDEFCVGNTHRGEGAIEWLNQQGVMGVRLGEQAYDINGKPLPKDIYRPLIIENSDGAKYDRVMMEKTFGQGFRRS